MNLWIVLRLVAREEHLWLEYEDESGFRWPSAGESRTISARGWSLRVLADLPERIAARPGAPIFVRNAMAISFADTVGLVRTIGDSVSDRPFVALARDEWREPARFKLPLRIGWVGRSSEAALAELRNVQSIAEAIQAGALELELDPSPGKSKKRTNIVFLDESTSHREQWVALDGKNERRPELLVSFDAALSSTVLSRNGPMLPQGVSMIAVQSPERASIAAAIVQSIVNDHPLHEAVHVSGAPLTLISDPAANHSLRLGDAAAKLFEETSHLNDFLAFDIKATDALLSNRRRTTQRMRSPRNAAAVRPPDRDDIAAMQEKIRSLMKDAQSGNDLIKMGRLSHAVAKLRDEMDPIRTIHARAAADPKVDATMFPREERRADVTLLRRDLGRNSTLFVPKESTLQTSSRYALRVQIGRPLAESIMVGEIPSIDVFLPPQKAGDGHLLTVVLYALDFTAVSTTAVQVALPPRGPSDPVFFDVIAPREPGTARMRVAIYYELPPASTRKPLVRNDYHNQLLQSFVIEAQVDQSERTTETAVTTARLEVSRRVRFEDLESLAPRIASLGFNESSAGRHTFMFKGSSVHGHANVTELAMNESLKAIRSILTDATCDEDGNPRFPEIDDVGDERTAAFDHTIRELARKGHSLYGAVRTPLSEAHQVVLDDITSSHDRVVQIIRYNTNYVFLWSLLYDFPRPKEKPNQGEAEVCKGFLRPKDGKPISCGDCLADCLHPDKSESFCVWGFWGFRHSIEQVLHAPNKEEPTIGEVKPVREQHVAVNVGTIGDYSRELTTELQTALGKEHVLSIVPPLDLIDVLWSDAARPAILIVLGHYQDDPQLGPGIEIAGDDWLMLYQLMDRKTKWTAPHPIVVLAACESAGADLSSLVSFVNEFANVRASAVVGSETPLFEGLACRLAKTLAQQLAVDDATLGQAMLHFRRSVLHGLNPLGLVVTAYGDANLHLVKGS